MLTRITQRTVGAQSLANLQANMARMQAAQEQVSSGRRVNRPSDSPVDLVAAMRYRGQLDRSDQYERNISDGVGWLSTADTSLTSINDQLGRIRELALRGMTSSLDADAREAIAVEVDQLRESIIGLANTTYLDRPIFGGTADTPVAFAADGTFQGDDGLVNRTIGAGVTVPVNLRGPAVFGDDASGLFATLSRLSADLRSNPSALSADLGVLDAQTRTVRNNLAEVGARVRRLEVAEARRGDDRIGIQQGLSDVEDVDLPKAMLDLKMQELAYQSALAVTARVVQPSLADFLR